MPVNRYWLSVILIAFTILSIISCKNCTTEPPEISDYDIQLSLIESTPTYVRLSVSISDSGNVRLFQLKRDSIIVMSDTLTGRDTILIDQNLEPNQEYWYQVLIVLKGKTVDSSEPLSIVTPDVSEHTFSNWDIQTIGGNNSSLNDIFYVDENNIWAVGMIHIGDSIYNAIHWDGNSWNYVHITGWYCNNLIQPDLNSIIYLSDNDIWALGSYPFHWDGNEWTFYQLTDMGIISGGLSGDIWATNSNDVYYIGRNGRIVHYNGHVFEKMNTGTDIDLTDIWGETDTETGESHIWVCGNDDDNLSSVILYLKDGEWTKLYERYVDGTNSLDEVVRYNPHCNTIWTHPSSEKLWIGGGYGLFTLDNKFSPTKYTEIDVLGQIGYFSCPHKIRGNNPYDIFITGGYSSLYHYNGQTWHRYYELVDENRELGKICISDDTVYIVGQYFGSFLSSALLIKGVR